MRETPRPTAPRPTAGSATLDHAVAWRHPRVAGVEGRCVGARSDWAVDARRAKRLAHRIRAVARREGLARVVAASPARRCLAVAGWLRRFGFAVRIDARLREFDFGVWDGRRWDAVARADLDAWCADFAGHAPGGGDTLGAFLARVRAVHADPPAPLLVTHGGWLSALRWLEAQHAAYGRGDAASDAEVQGRATPRAADWPPPPACGGALRWRIQRGATRAVAAAAAAASGAATDAGRVDPGAGVLGS